MMLGDISNYFGMLVKIETVRRTGHSVHCGVLVDSKRNYCLIRTRDNRMIWVKKPNRYKDSFEILEDGL